MNPEEFKQSVLHKKLQVWKYNETPLTISYRDETLNGQVVIEFDQYHILTEHDILFSLDKIVCIEAEEIYEDGEEGTEE